MSYTDNEQELPCVFLSTDTEYQDFCENHYDMFKSEFFSELLTMIRSEEIFFGQQSRYSLDDDCDNSKYEVGLEKIIGYTEKFNLPPNYTMAELLIEYGKLDMMKHVFNGPILFNEFMDGSLVECAIRFERLDLAQFFLSKGAKKPRMIEYRYLNDYTDYLIYYKELYAEYGKYGVNVMFVNDIYSGTLIFEEKVSYESRHALYEKKYWNQPFKMSPEDMIMKQNNRIEYIKKDTGITEEKVAKLLTLFGTNSFSKDDSEDVINWLICLGYFNLFKKLFGKNLDTTRMLRTAARYGRLEIFQYILAIDTSSQIRDLNEYLTEAATNGKMNIVVYLIEEKKVKVTDTALCEALTSRHENVVCYLAKHGNRFSNLELAKKRDDMLRSYCDSWWDINGNNTPLGQEQERLKQIGKCSL
jgi:hypothetical protein